MSISDWDLIRDAISRAGTVPILASIIAVPEKVVEHWSMQGATAAPTTRAVRALRRYVADFDAPKVHGPKKKEKGSRGDVVGDSYCRWSKPAAKIRSGDRTRYGHSKKL